MVGRHEIQAVLVASKKERRTNNWIGGRGISGWVDLNHRDQLSRHLLQSLLGAHPWHLILDTKWSSGRISWRSVDHELERDRNQAQKKQSATGSDYRSVHMDHPSQRASVRARAKT